MSHHHHLRWVAALILLAAMPAMASQCHIQLLPSVPVTLQGLRPMVSTRINGRKTRFIIDTGAFRSLLSPAAAAPL